VDVRRPVVAVLDYGIGNLHSAQKALEKAGADAQLTTDPAFAAAADGVVLPGVGAMARCMEALEAAGLRGVALDAAASGKPFLGVCVGMQMMHAGSEEHGGVEGLGIFQGTVRRLTGQVKIPQMQWNIIDPLRPTWLLDGLPTPTWVYFVHSYAPELHADVVATCDYGGPVGAVVLRGNVAGTQFHPEKSAATGIALLGNFVQACRTGLAVA
jgi:imidazole glycerol-phosphate synthase subunit HisH